MAKEAIAKAIETAPDIAIVDYSLPLFSGLEVTKQIRKRLPGTEVLIFTLHDNEHFIRQLLKAGARGYLLKSDAGRDVVAAYRRLRPIGHILRRRCPKRCFGHLLRNRIVGVRALSARSANCSIDCREP